MRLRGNVYRSSITDVKRRYTKHCNVNKMAYSSGLGPGSQKPVWYFLEPHGLALTHSPRPNFSCRPFANAITGQVVSLLWPVVSVGEGGLCSRDFVPELYPGETKQSRAAREAAILGFRGRSSPGASLVIASGESGITPGSLPTLSPVPSPSPHPPSTFPSSLPIFLYISPSTSHPIEWAERLAGFSIAPTHTQADMVLGYPELLAGNSNTPTPTPAARLAGDAVLVHKSQFCRLARGRRGCVWGVDIRGEVAHIAEVGGRSLTGRWCVLCPDGPWSAVTPHVTDCQLEVVRWSEVGAGAATQFCVRTVLHNSHRCCLQFSVVVVPTAAGRTVFLHPHPRVRLAPKPVSSEGFQPWDTAALLTSAQCTVSWSEVLASLETQYSTDWAQVQSEISQAVAAVFAAALPCCGGERAIYTVDVLLQSKKQLVPLIIGVNPLPSFANTVIAKECLDLLLGQGGTECFIPI